MQVVIYHIASPEFFRGGGRIFNELLVILLMTDVVLQIFINIFHFSLLFLKLDVIIHVYMINILGFFLFPQEKISRE